MRDVGYAQNPAWYCLNAWRHPHCRSLVRPQPCCGPFRFLHAWGKAGRCWDGCFLQSIQAPNLFHQSYFSHFCSRKTDAVGPDTQAMHIRDTVPGLCISLPYMLKDTEPVPASTISIYMFNQSEVCIGNRRYDRLSLIPNAFMWM